MVKSLILCEGGDDVGFLNCFCKYLALEQNVTIKNMNNKSNFFKEEKYKVHVQQIEKGLFKNILLIVDADFAKDNKVSGGFQNSEKELNKMIAKLGIQDKASIYIMCDPSTRNGNLEHLILSTVENEKKECIEKFIRCIKPMDTPSNKKIILFSYQTIFKETPYNLDHENFKNLKEIIQELVK